MRVESSGVTHCALTLRYIELGVRNSEESDVHTGTRLGAFSSLPAWAESTSRMASREGCMVTYIHTTSINYYLISCRYDSPGNYLRQAPLCNVYICLPYESKLFLPFSLRTSSLIRIWV